MKRIILSVVMVMTVVWTGTSQRTPGRLTEAWDRANTAYTNADYGNAIRIYDSIAEAGYGGVKLYYNLGNSYYKEGLIGRSILNYNRALRLDPSDPDIKHNLAVAGTHVKDKIETVPQFFLSAWFNSVRRSISADGWAVISLLLIALALGSVLFYLLSAKMILRKTGFYTALAALCLGVLAIIFASRQKYDMVHTSEAIVMSSAAPIKSSPDNSSRDIFILHEGTKVNIIRRLNEWVEISIADGNKGWINERSIEGI